MNREPGQEAPFKSRLRTDAPRPKERQAGQGMGEYLIIIGAISLTAVGVMGAYGDTVRHQVAGLAQELSGQDAGEMIAGARSAANRGTQMAKEGGAFFGSKLPGDGGGNSGGPGGAGPGDPATPPGGGGPGAGGDPGGDPGGGDSDPPVCNVSAP